MKLTKLLWMAATASMIFVACSKDETSGGVGGADVTTDNSLKSVTVTIPNISKAATRATGDAMAAGSQVSLTNYKVFFLDASGNEVTIPQFNSEDQQVYFTSEEGTGWDANVGSSNAKTYHFLPAATSSVVVVGNLGNITYEGIADSYDVLNDGDVTGDNVDAAGHPYYPLYGASNLTLTGGTDDQSHENVYTASVTLAPQIARFEIYGFEYILDEDNSSTEYTFTQIDLDRIALSNYYTAYDLKEGTALGDLVAAPTDHAEVWTWIEELSAGSPWFNSLLDPTTGNRLALGQGEAKYVNGDDLDPTTDVTGEGATGIVTFGIVDYSINGTTDVVNPELLLSFYGDADETATDLTPLYLRGTFNSADPFQAGKIYRVLFPIIDGAWEQPERCVELTITVAEWAVEVVTPEF